MNETPRPVLVGLMMLTFATGIVDAASVLGLGHVGVELEPSATDGHGPREADAGRGAVL